MKDLEALLQCDKFHFKAEEKGEKHITLYKELKIKTVKDEESTQVNATSRFVNPENVLKHFNELNLDNHLILMGKFS